MKLEGVVSWGKSCAQKGFPGKEQLSFHVQN